MPVYEGFILFRGQGGNGNSFLLYLKTKCCKVLPTEDCAYTGNLTGQDLVDNFTNAPQAAPISADRTRQPGLVQAHFRVVPPAPQSRYDHESK